VDEGIFVTLGGQEQYLLIRGQNADNPVIVWLHGGPAGPDAYTTYCFICASKAEQIPDSPYKPEKSAGSVKLCQQFEYSEIFL
jgi:hypothetical protein